jgi:arylsulfatase A-like enzyme
MKVFGSRATTPNIDRVAADGARFEQAICQAPFTPASHASILSGVNPYRHGIRGMFGFRLSDTIKPLAVRLKEMGYHTAAFIGSHALGSHYGLGRGFGVYDEQFEHGEYRSLGLGYRRPAWETTDRVLDWLKRGQTPFFLFVHYFDAHGVGEQPSKASGGVRVVLDRLRRAMIGGADRPSNLLHLIRTLRLGSYFRSSRHIRHQLNKTREIDQQIGRILGFLDHSSLYDDTFLVIVSDHGEAFGEHGEVGHRTYLYDTTIRIPFIMKTLPGLAGTRIPFLTRSIDICPSLLAALRTPAENMDGVDLHALADSGSDTLKAYSETRFEVDPDEGDDLKTHLTSLRTSRWKLIVDRLDGSKQLYHLDTDPQEDENVYFGHPEVVRGLEVELESMTAERAPEEGTKMTSDKNEEIRKRLRALGYL